VKDRFGRGLHCPLGIGFGAALCFGAFSLVLSVLMNFFRMSVPALVIMQTGKKQKREKNKNCQVVKRWPYFLVTFTYCCLH